MTAGAELLSVWRHQCGRSRGCALTSGVAVLTHPRIDTPQAPYDLNLEYVYGASSDPVSVTYAI